MIRNVLIKAPLRSVSVSCLMPNAAVGGQNASRLLLRTLNRSTTPPAVITTALSQGSAKRCYTRVIYQNPRKDNGTHHNGNDLPEILPQKQPIRIRSNPIRFLNPWVDLANVTDDGVLAQKVDSVTRTFGVVAGLMCSLSAAALAVIPSADEEHQHNVNDNSRIGNSTLNPSSTTRRHTSTEHRNSRDHHTSVQRRDTRSMFTSKHVAGTSVLTGMGLSGKQLADVYAACCAGSFYSSVCAMGLSAVVNAWLACTPAGGTRCKYSVVLRSPWKEFELLSDKFPLHITYFVFESNPPPIDFVRYNSLVICSIPGFLALSTGLAGTALFIGLDRSTGSPVSYIGLGGTAVGGILVGTATVRGMVGTYRLLTPLVRKL